MKRVIQLLIILLSHQLIAQESRQFRIDSLLTVVHSNGLFNGVALVADSGKIILHKAYGLSDKETKTSLSINDRFYIGSITKQFTAVLILQLQEEGLVDINKPISDYLVEFKDTIWQKITVHNLLTHTSGLGSYTSNPIFDRSIDYSDEEMFKLIQEPLIFDPNSDWSYSNSGYYLLGKIAERVSKNNYGALLKMKIFDPLKMNNTSFSLEWQTDNMANGYWRTIGGVHPSPKYSLVTLFSTGGIFSTAADLFIWAQALDGNQLLSEKSKKILYTPVRDDYACGLYVKKGIDENGNQYERHFHGGIIRGYHSFMLKRIPEKQVIILLDNYHNNEIQTIKNRIWSALVNEEIREVKPMLSNYLFEESNSTEFIKLIDSISNNLNHFKLQYKFEEYNINGVAYRLMEAERYDEAKAVFLFNIKLFPSSWNVYDGMGELEMNQTNYDEAEKLYKKSLTLNPDNISAKNALKNIKLHTTKPKLH